MADIEEGEVLDNQQEQVIRELEECRAFYFAQRIESRNDLRVLAVPKSFTKHCGWPETRHVVLVTSITRPIEWPVELRLVGAESRSKLSAYSIGGGFPKFCADQRLCIGDLLILEWVNGSCLVATIQKRSPQKKTPTETPAGIPDGAGPSRPSRPRAQFQKTLRPSHIRPNKTARIDIPTAYWREHGKEKFNGQLYTLEGPLKESCVKSALHETGRQTLCFLTSGWFEFCVLNKLKLGDTVNFLKRGPCGFQVTIGNSD